MFIDNVSSVIIATNKMHKCLVISIHEEISRKIVQDINIFRNSGNIYFSLLYTENKVSLYITLFRIFLFNLAKIKD